jgi:hypothetical protein
MTRAFHEVTTITHLVDAALPLRVSCPGTILQGRTPNATAIQNAAVAQVCSRRYGFAAAVAFAAPMHHAKLGYRARKHDELAESLSNYVLGEMSSHTEIIP